MRASKAPPSSGSTSPRPSSMGPISRGRRPSAATSPAGSRFPASRRIEGPMSEDGTAKRLDTDPAARVAADLRARLRSLPAAELVELAAQLMTTYVIEGVLPLQRAGESSDLAADQAGEESFAQMLKRLKAQRRDPVLDRFIIDGENISVRIDGQGVLPLTEYRRPNVPPPGPG